ncbi:hypothetical protein [Burkholderia sp. THE68]|uniref:hypothetical protein n=1 Tax=Burkholderia sp. THE68 TaxID=758782 RepID=UPI00138A6AAB|nr:hypothetical protein [Burkholderia sp. THE68]
MTKQRPDPAPLLVGTIPQPAASGNHGRSLLSRHSKSRARLRDIRYRHLAIKCLIEDHLHLLLLLITAMRKRLRNTGNTDAASS